MEQSYISKAFSISLLFSLLSIFYSGSIVGAKTSDFLLEKSRIVTQAPDERNYHIFYEMLQGLGDQQMKKYGLQAAEKYFYLNQVILSIL